ncbi:MAG: class I SAM-dependent methyltransferase [Alphaproteobacteria bacterium]|nr:class I SAM-dependent methyltransferase [Alphaproteobacteria bacterium]
MTSTDERDLDRLWHELSAPEIVDDHLQATVPAPAYDVLHRLWTTGHAEGEPTPHARGELPRGHCAILFNVVRALRPNRTLEVGLGKATSAVTILSGCEENPAHVEHVAIDPLQTSSYLANGVKNVHAAGYGKKFRVLEHMSCVGMPVLFIQERLSFDFVFIDATHMFEHTMLEWFYADRMIPIGGVVLFDDANAPAVSSVVNFVEANMPYRVARLSTWLSLAMKTGKDERLWYEFERFEVPDGEDYAALVKQGIAEREAAG